MAGTLYLVGTPIGNLGDISPRALEILSTVDFIAAEDTRVTLKILNHFAIKKPLICYFEHNRAEMGEKLLSRLLGGESCALVTDAGMPAISDPGEDIVRRCAEEGVAVCAVPGPCAAVTALAVSGLPTQRFTFEGFISVNGKSRREHLESLKGEKRTMIIYEAPHKLLRTLSDLLDALGDRPVAVCRELTKLHEEILRTTLSGALAHFVETPPRGEFVLIVGGKPEQTQPSVSAENALEAVEALRAEGLGLKAACKAAAQTTGFSSNGLYSMYINARSRG
ncbi:MAG: 16S rRNA (cytidine(1402)-2'-O)-methyltransferase [Oscillospiraceae bacterium]|nr:16S rRNA (cytidine(1402)-2'-O)-methyltransferase [Oscillospiraceae bacterium]